MDAEASSRFSDAIDAIYDAAASPQRWSEALEAIAAVFDDVGCLLIFQRFDGSFGTIVSPRLEAPQRDYAEGGWARNDIRMERAIEGGYLVSGDALTERHILSDEEVATLPFYTEFLARHGLKWFAGTFVSADPRLALALSIQRAANRPPYSDDELALFGRLGRHVENAFRLGIRLINAEVLGKALADALSQLSVGVCVVDETARILFSNNAARALLGNGLAVSGGRLTASLQLERRALSDAIEMVAASGGSRLGQPQPILLHSGQSEPFVAVYVLPIRQHVDPVLSEARAIVLAIESTAHEPDPAIVRDLMGLTLGEARVAALIGSGLGLREAAAKLGIAETTARSVLKRVFAKTGVSRQSELSALLTRLVLG
jgi:DNA-binding CsgD family transcriptional regulator